MNTSSGRPPASSDGGHLRDVVLDEPGGPVEGGVAFVEEGGECLEDVRDAGGDVQDDGHVVGCGLRRGRVASSRRTSCDPAWISSGGSPDRSAKMGLTRGSAGSVPAREFAGRGRRGRAVVAGGGRG